MSLRLGIDLDGVTVALQDAVNRFVAHHWGVEEVPVDRWDWTQGYAIPSAEIWERFYAEGVDYIATAGPIPGAIVSLQRLAEEHDVRFITYRPDVTRDATRLWLTRANLDLPVHYEQQKWTVPCDLYVDDHGPTIKEMDDRGCRAVMFDQPWNWSFTPATRAHSWSDIEELVACI